MERHNVGEVAELAISSEEQAWHLSSTFSLGLHYLEKIAEYSTTSILSLDPLYNCH